MADMVEFAETTLAKTVFAGMKSCIPVSMALSEKSLARTWAAAP
jgi:hypothetical protein